MRSPGNRPLAQLTRWALIGTCCLALVGCSEEDTDDDGIVGPPGSTDLPTHDELRAALEACDGAAIERLLTAGRAMRERFVNHVAEPPR